MAEEEHVDSGDGEGANFKAKNLREFMRSKQAAKSFLSSLEQGEATLPDHENREAFAETALGDEKSAARMCELVRAAVAEETPGRIRKALIGIGTDFIRKQDKALSNWSLNATSSPEIELGMLARHVRKARETKNKPLIANAELSLSTGLAILTTRTTFDAVGALMTLGTFLFPEPLEPHVADKKSKRALRRATTRNLEMFAAISASHSAALSNSRKKTGEIAGELQACREQLRTCHDARASAEAEAQKLQHRATELEAQLEQLSGRIAGVKGGAADDITRLKARARQFYQSKLLDVLSTAREALSIDPPSVRVAKERIHDVISDVRKEVEWLDQS